MASTATPLVKLDNFEGFAELYLLDAPIKWSDHRDSGATEYIVVSSIRACGYPTHDETMAFPADESGNVVSWRELVSVWEYSHDAALASMGLRVG